MAELRDEKILSLQEQGKINIERPQEASCRRPENFWGERFCEICGAMLPHGQPTTINEAAWWDGEPHLVEAWLCRGCRDQLDPDVIVE